MWRCTPRSGCISALGMALEIVDNRIDLKSLADLVEHDE